MSSPLNGPLEVGMRVLVVLVNAYPRPLDMSKLVLLDFALLHSSDLGGPESLHPPTPVRSGELSVRRDTVRQGLDTLVRAELVEMDATIGGIEFSASEDAWSLVNVLESAYTKRLDERASWVVREFAELEDAELRQTLRKICGLWEEEFEYLSAGENGVK